MHIRGYRLLAGICLLYTSHLTAKATSDSGVLLDRDLPVSEEAFALIREFDHHFPRIVASYKDDAVLSCLIPDNNRHSRSCLVIPLTKMCIRDSLRP